MYKLLSVRPATNPLSLKLTERLVRTIVVVLVAISAFSNKK